MSNNYQNIVDKYIKLFQEYSLLKNNLTNLENIKDGIAEERFQAQKQEYDSKINQLFPEMDNLKKTIEETLEEISSTYKELDVQLKKKNEDIEQEKKMYDAGALSKELYKAITLKLQKEQKIILLQHQEANYQILLLQKALSGEKFKNSPSITFSKFYNSNESSALDSSTTFDSSQRSLGKDFNKGCLAIILIAILLPMLGLLIASTKLMALIVIPVLGFIIIVAIFGKSLNFIQKIWK